MRIMFVVDDYTGGAGNIIQLLSAEYAKDNDVSVILTYQHGEKRYPCENVVFYEMPVKEKPAGVMKMMAQRVKRIREIIDTVRPEIIISFLPGNTIDVAFAVGLKKIPIIASERINPSFYKRNFGLLLMQRYAYAKARLVTVQFDAFKSFDGGRYEKKCVTTPNYIAPPARFKQLDLKRDKTVFISCGRLQKLKRFDIMLDVFKRIHDANAKTELRIYGQGPLRDSLAEKIKDLGLSDSAFLMGYTKDVYGTLCEGDVYLMTSENEGFPNALSEALAAGLPAIAFKCHDGIAEFSDHGRRFALYDPGDEEGYVKRALAFCQNEGGYCAYAEAAKEVAEVYSMKNIKAIWDQCISRAMNK